MLSHDIPDLRPNELDTIHIEMSHFDQFLKTKYTWPMWILQFLAF